MFQPTPDEQATLDALPREVQFALSEYPSIVENYLRVSALPKLSKDEGCRIFEVYYDCEDCHSLYIENGVMFSADRPINEFPRIIEVMGSDDFVLIQVMGHTIANRLNENVPAVHSVAVSV